jgi:putative ABC transport system ATP-binding protein
VSYVDEDGVPRVNALSLAIPAGDHLALLGPAEGGRSEIAMLLGRILAPTAGRIRLGRTDLNAVPFAESARRLAYVGPAEQLLAGSIRENLLFGLHRPSPASLSEAGSVGGAAGPDPPRKQAGGRAGPDRQ